RLHLQRALAVPAPGSARRRPEPETEDKTPACRHAGISLCSQAGTALGAELGVGQADGRALRADARIVDHGLATVRAKLRPDLQRPTTLAARPHSWRGDAQACLELCHTTWAGDVLPQHELPHHTRRVVGHEHWRR